MGSLEGVTESRIFEFCDRAQFSRGESVVGNDADDSSQELLVGRGRTTRVDGLRLNRTPNQLEFGEHGPTSQLVGIHQRGPVHDRRLQPRFGPCDQFTTKMS